MNKDAIDFIRNFTHEEANVAHLMFKPEFCQLADKYPQIGSAVTEKLLGQSRMLGVDVVDLGTTILTPRQLDIIYKKEINNGWIRDERLSSLSTLPTHHMIGLGENVKAILTMIRGRVSCKGGDTCFKVHHPHLQLPDHFTHECPPAGTQEKLWGKGCGLRHDLVLLGQIEPDEGRANDSTWNMIHASTTDDKYVMSLLESFTN